jgi:hypothetical protein
VNLRPITRLALVAWLLGGLLAVWNVRQAWTLWRGLGSERATLEGAQRALSAERQRLSEIERELLGIDLPAENARTLFLDREVDRRVFSWTHLFESLGRVLPREVRLVQVRPLLVAPGQPRGRGARTAASVSPDLWVTVQVNGFAERDESLLDLVDALFADPAFADPDLKREAVPPGRPVQFDLEVRYLPSAISPREGDAEPASAPPPSRTASPERSAAAGASVPSPVPGEGSAPSGPSAQRASEAVAAAGEEAGEASPLAPAPARAASAPRQEGPGPRAGVPAVASEAAAEPPVRATPAMRPRDRSGRGETLAPGFVPVPLGDPASATRRIVP